MNTAPLSAVSDDVLLELDHQLCFALHAAARRVVRAYGPVLAELELTYPQYLVMLVLWAWDRDDHPAPTVKALGARLELDSGTLTPLLRRLEQKALLTRERATQDERELLVRVTRRGRALKKRARKMPLSLLESSPFTLDEILELRERLHVFRNAHASAPAADASL